MTTGRVQAGDAAITWLVRTNQTTFNVSQTRRDENEMMLLFLLSGRSKLLDCEINNNKQLEFKTIQFRQFRVTLVSRSGTR